MINKSINKKFIILISLFILIVVVLVLVLTSSYALFSFSKQGTVKNKLTTGTYSSCEYKDGTTWEFDYTGNEETFTVPCSGEYKIETWGAQGGSYNTTYRGGYGGYSIGNISLPKGNILYINIGGVGKNGEAIISKNYGDGGYNGGGSRGGYSCSDCNFYSGGGGGATHIATISGLLSTLENDIDKILIVSGGGGGNGYVNVGWNYNSLNIASGGGMTGNNGQTVEGRGGTPGTQTSGYLFGQGRNCSGTGVCDGGGGGFYGGFSGCNGAGGGSGYIGNSLLTDKVMYCYNCTESSEESTKTVSTTCTSSTATSNCSKQGNGYAKITLVSADYTESILNGTR